MAIRYHLVLLIVSCLKITQCVEIPSGFRPGKGKMLMAHSCGCIFIFDHFQPSSIVASFNLGAKSTCTVKSGEVPPYDAAITMAGMESHVQHTAKELDSEQYIAEILNPARKSGLARDRKLFGRFFSNNLQTNEPKKFMYLAISFNHPEVENPDSREGRTDWLRLTHSVAARVHLIDQDFKSLRAGLNRVIHEIQEEISTLGREVGGRRSEQKEEELRMTMEIAQKMDHIHEKLLEPTRNQIFKLQGKELTDTATHQDDHMTESQPSKVIGDANIGSSDKMQENSENNHTARTSKEKSLKRNPLQNRMDRLSNDLLADMEKCLEASLPMNEAPAFTMTYRIGFETVGFMYKHELTTQKGFESFFAKDAISYHHCYTMLSHYTQDPTFKWLPMDMKSILHSWDSEIDRNVFEALDINNQRRFALFFITEANLIPRLFPGYNPEFSICFEKLMEILRRGLIPWSRMGELVASKFPTVEEPIKSARALSKEILQNFERIDIFEKPGKRNIELGVLFQFFEFFEENYPTIWEMFSQTKSFLQEYKLTSQSMQFIREIENIGIYLIKYFPKTNLKELKSHKEFNRNKWFNFHKTTNRKKLFTPLEELELISSHIEKIDSTHQKSMLFLLDGDPVNSYCQHEYVRNRITALHQTIEDMKKKAYPNTGILGRFFQGSQ
ncbi:hypothetical protein PSHT_10931 [Puccinia striiformis]|uniref:Uncharacterized protein n=1 Tax=Puccinia striiformis TaxID=27350 RepID=A0A2S4V6I6_9BASI|nr:hypothetical protein PSHT_10931 [Puccinia striiformis]